MWMLASLKIMFFLKKHDIYSHIMLKMFGLKEWIHDYNNNMCGMLSYTVSDKKLLPTISVSD
jgi:hypothetical protein